MRYYSTALTHQMSDFEQIRLVCPHYPQAVGDALWAGIGCGWKYEHRV